jgi:hypothetical protein
MWDGGSLWTVVLNGFVIWLIIEDPTYNEYCLSCLSNLGDLSVYSLPNLKRQVQTQCMKQQDINAITSFVFSKYGQAFYLQSPSEFLHISMSARDTIMPNLNLFNLFKTAMSTGRDDSVEQQKAKAKNKVKSSTLPSNQQGIDQTAAHIQTTQANLQPSNQNERMIPSPTSPPPPIPAPIPAPRTSSNRDVVNTRYAPFDS